MYQLMYLFLLVFLMIFSIQFSVHYALSANDKGFFQVPEEQFFNPSDYGGEYYLSSGDGNYSQPQSKDESYNDDSGQVTDSINFHSFKFALVGDWGCTKNTLKTVNLIQKHNPDIVFDLGDTSYKKDIKCWTDIVKPISNRMKAVLGNHDVMSPSLSIQHMKNFGLDKPYYSFDYDNIHYLMIDSEASYFPGSDPDFSDLKDTAQYRFVENDLSKAHNNSNIKWIFVMSHRQFYSSLCGEHDSCEPIKKFRDTYHPLFEKYGVDLIFSGHAHNYQRTYPLIYNEVNSSEPIIEDKSNTEYTSKKGMFQVIVGTGGIDLDGFSNQEPFVAYQQDTNYGFLNIDVVDQGNTLLGQYYSNTGKIVDAFKITK